MNALLVTIFVSLCLAGFFVVAFWADRSRRGVRGVEHDALLPFDEPAGGPRGLARDAAAAGDPTERGDAPLSRAEVRS